MLLGLQWVRVGDFRGNDEMTATEYLSATESSVGSVGDSWRSWGRCHMAADVSLLLGLQWVWTGGPESHIGWLIDIGFQQGVKCWVVAWNDTFLLQFDKGWVIAGDQTLFLGLDGAIMQWHLVQTLTAKIYHTAPDVITVQLKKQSGMGQMM